MSDVKHLIAEVAVRHGIRIDSDDPAFCLVTLNQLMLEESAKKVADQIRAAMKDFEEAVEKVEGRVGIILSKELQQVLKTLKDHEVKEKRESHVKTKHWNRLAWIANVVLSALLIFGCGVLVGMAIQ